MSQLIFIQGLKIPLYCIKFLWRHLNKLHVSKNLSQNMQKDTKEIEKIILKIRKMVDETFTIIFVMSMNSNIIHNIKFKIYKSISKIKILIKKFLYISNKKYKYLKYVTK